MKRAGQSFDPAVMHVASTVTRESGSGLPLMILALLQYTPGNRRAHIRLAGYRATVYPQSLHKIDVERWCNRSVGSPGPFVMCSLCGVLPTGPITTFEKWYAIDQTQAEISSQRVKVHDNQRQWQCMTTRDNDSAWQPETVISAFICMWRFRRCTWHLAAILVPSWV